MARRTPRALAALLALAATAAVHAAGPAQPAPAATAGARPATAASAEQDEEQAARELRQAALKVQQRLRAQHKAREAARRDETKNERCIGNQRMRRVANGWVDAGNC
ncbi:hypothetical protein ACFPN1_13095 [Lysobacter yangpyeongensis]|uniref:Uncharacterized protein n=1 Tax=Lysobacter yangpyeongensis TaxID=346182 RepID=A0ABW0SPL1_9GAMM